MRFFVIYSADVPEDTDLDPYRPVGDEWNQTEDGESEYSYLEGIWERGTHGKWCAELDRPAFNEFVRVTGLAAEDCQTGGSITFQGHLPAISFRAEDGEAFVDAYVTPILEHLHAPGDERQWERVRKAVIAHYGY